MEDRALFDLINDDPDELLKPEVSIAGTQFRLDKIPTMEGYHILEGIRRAAADTIRDPLPMISVDPSLAILFAILKFEVPFVESLRMKLFAHIKFSSATTSLVRLKGSEDEAFEKCEPSAVYEILFRSLAVNFTASFRNLLGDLSSLPNSEKVTTPQP